MINPDAPMMNSDRDLDLECIEAHLAVVAKCGQMAAHAMTAGDTTKARLLHMVRDAHYQLAQNVVSVEDKKE